MLFPQPSPPLRVGGFFHAKLAPYFLIPNRMEHKPLGETGIRLPEIALGTSSYTGGGAPLCHGIDLGAFFIDTAETYGTEEVVGEAIRGIRQRAFIATKVAAMNLKRGDLLKAADRSLQRLQTDHIDLYQVHSPNASIPIAETMAAMEDLVDAGKVRFIGVSNFTTAELKKARAALRKHPIVSNQVRYSLVDRTIETQLLSYCQQHCITILAYSPLGGGPQNLRASDKRGILRKVAAETGKTEAQIALNWCIAKERVIAITKSNSADRIAEACSASGWRLSAEQMRMLDEEIPFRKRSSVEIILRGAARRALDRIRL